MESRTNAGLPETTDERPSATADPQPSRRTRWLSRALLVSLAIYWLLIFTGTHIPEVPGELTLVDDKLLHFTAYLGLSVLLLSWRSTRATIGWKSVAWIWLGIGAYAVFDELTQSLFGRDTELADLLADLLGAAIGLGLTWPLAPRILRCRNG